MRSRKRGWRLRLEAPRPTLIHVTDGTVLVLVTIGGRLEGAVRSHAQRALEAGATPQEIEHVVLLAVTTSGFPTAVAAFTWVEDLLGPGKQPKGKAR